MPQSTSKLYFTHKVTQKCVTIQSLAVHRHADWKSSEVLQFTIHLWSFTEHYSLTAEVARDLKYIQNKKKQTRNGSNSSEDPKLIWRGVMNTLFESVIVTVVTKLKELACTMPDMDAGARPWVEAVNKVFSNLLGIPGLLRDLDNVRRGHTRNVLWTIKTSPDI